MPTITRDGYHVTLDEEEWETIVKLIRFHGKTNYDEDSEAFRVWDDADDIMREVADELSEDTQG